MPTITRESVCQIVGQHTAHVCRTMLNTTVEVLQDTPALDNQGASVLSLIGLTGRWNGSGSLWCSGDVARRLSGAFLMTEFAEVDAEVLDAMGELANMIIGNIKDDLARELGALAISTPTVVHGEGLLTRSVEGETYARVAFACEGGVLEVRISLVPTQPGV